ncbi:hypothetical protein [Mycobacterium riyadhense]|uniref:hypothetical protein n=1 Tax=Mycobacterium riyadhense TaxID=486698 RepID=UPI00195E333E|nr:hypothetical protein [Mycobacterium riyadhense]
MRDSDLGEPEILRRRDGASVYSTHGNPPVHHTAILSRKNVSWMPPAALMGDALGQRRRNGAP